MSQVGDIERMTQDRVVRLLREQLGYSYLGNWETRTGNSNIEEAILRRYLREERGYSETLIDRALYELSTAARDLGDGLYKANKKVYGLLRYGVQVKAEVGDLFETVHLVDWKQPFSNEFAVAEEVTVSGEHDKRPDIVLYVNGIALGVLELKRSIVSIGDGIRQSIGNQQKDFIQPFFSTVQWVLAGNDTEGLRYGTIGTPEKYFLTWKEDSEIQNLLDRYLLKLCEKQRFLEIIQDFTLFDGGVRKLCRPHQYFAVKSAQEFAKRREGGIIWHTQGSGKSLVMVWLAKWLLENNPHARVAVVTDRDELDKQIERVFRDAGEQMIRSRSGRELMEHLGRAQPRMLCCLVHKFGNKDVENFSEFIRELEASPSRTVGELFIFVDECHRTQSGRLHKTMKAILRNAVFIGFTGTPLLRADKQTSLEVFGGYIHTYKFNEGVEDGVVLDLVYEARDIDQKLTSPQKIDEWFEAKTRGLNDFQKSELKQRWGTLQKVLSARSRLDKVVNDIIFDFNVRPRLSSDRGNAILVASSIHEACKYYDLLQKTELKGKCAIVTSYNPATKDIVTEDTGAGTETERQFIYNTYRSLLGEKSTETYEDEAKAKFRDEPASMRLLIVVDRLLVGFDAPPCSYLYIDKSMQDHGLFQAICRVNRLHTEDKQFGYIIDYKDLFKKMENAVGVYTSELDYDTFGKEEVDVILKSRLEKGRERLDKALEEIALLCEPVEPPRDQISYIRYFCGDPENKDDLKDTETRRTFLYRDAADLLRAYSDVSGEMEEAGYSQTEIGEIKSKVDFYLNLREEIKNASGEKLDLKAYEADMRHLIDTYIEASVPRVISPFNNMSLLDIVVNSGIDSAITALPPGIRANRQAAAEAIINNVRRRIIEEHLIDPAYFEEMSKLLDQIIKERKANAINYEEYLRRVADLARRVTHTDRDDLPAQIKTAAQRALYNNTGKDEALALRLDAAVRQVRRADWRGNTPKENEIKSELFSILGDDDEVERLFAIIKQQSEY